eukprot:1139464-Pelagomonas_calceolata.AAC.1
MKWHSRGSSVVLLLTRAFTVPACTRCMCACAVAFLAGWPPARGLCATGSARQGATSLSWVIWCCIWCCPWVSCCCIWCRLY